MLQDFADHLLVTTEIYPGPEKGAFEIMLNGTKIHSKLTMRHSDGVAHGKVQTDEELDALIEHVQAKISQK